MYKQGDIVLVPIPFTDLTSSKKRPVLILSNNNYNNTKEDIIVAAITSNLYDGNYSIMITNDDMVDGNLLRDSCVRADKLYTLSQSLIIKKFGKLRNETIITVVNNVFNLIDNKEKT